MSIQNIDVRRVSALPGTLIANTIYLVKADGEDIVSMFVTNNDGTIEAQQVGLIHRGDYASGTAYTRGNLALDQNSTWLNLRGSTGTAPPTLPTSSNADWQLFAGGGADGTPGANGTARYPIGVFHRTSDGSNVIAALLPAEPDLSADMTMDFFHADIRIGASGGACDVTIEKNGTAAYGPIAVTYGSPVTTTGLSVALAQGDMIDVRIDNLVAVSTGDVHI